MAFTYIHTCYRVLDPQRSEDFYVNKLGSLFRERKVSRDPVLRPAD
jgi:catechol 2,3-dioxygenase-like lactoylglutathione lyase family enzyme